MNIMGRTLASLAGASVVLLGGSLMPQTAFADDNLTASATVVYTGVDIMDFSNVAADATDEGNVVDDRYSNLDAPGAPPYPITCYQPEFDTKHNPASGQVAITFQATNGCNGRSHVKIWNFYIHSTSWGQGTPTASCESYDGECTANVYWASRPLPCNTVGEMDLPFSLNWYNKSNGNRFSEGTERIRYEVVCG